MMLLVAYLLLGAVVNLLISIRSDFPAGLPLPQKLLSFAFSIVFWPFTLTMMVLLNPKPGRSRSLSLNLALLIQRMVTSLSAQQQDERTLAIRNGAIGGPAASQRIDGNGFAGKSVVGAAGIEPATSPV